jgi:hypothetical protein
MSIRFLNRGLMIAAGSLCMLTACGSDGQREEMRTGGAVATDAATAQLALGELTGHVDTTVTLYGSNGSASGSGSAQPGADPNGAPRPSGGLVSLPCAAGGNANIGGHVNVTTAPVAVDVAVMIAYAGCTTATGTTIAGDIDFSQSVVAAPGAFRVETLYQGDLVFSGKVNARCAIDLNVLVDETGAAVQVAGSFCGQDASALQLQVSPRWRTSS